MFECTKVGHGMIIKLKGSPYEQGVEQGKTAKKLIEHNVKLIKEKIKNSKVDESYYKDLVKKNLAFIEKLEPDMVEEMKGISSGSNIDFEDILYINLPLYFMLDKVPQECSSIMARGTATLDGKTYLVKNRDMREDVKHIIVEKEYADGKKVVEVNGAGIITYPGNGMNSQGLALSTTGVWPRMLEIDFSLLDRVHALINTSLILKKCNSVDDVISYLENLERMNGMNFVVVDKNNAAAIEVTKDKVLVQRDKMGILARTNHYIIDEIAYLNPTLHQYPSTHKRYERIMECLNAKYGSLRFQDMLQIASDHENGPEHGICRHGYGNDGITVYSSIIVLEDNQVWTSLKNPCQSLIVSSL